MSDDNYHDQVKAITGKLLKLSSRNQRDPVPISSVHYTSKDGIITVKIEQNSVLNICHTSTGGIPTLKIEQNAVPDGEASMYLSSLGHYLGQQKGIAVDYQPSRDGSNTALTFSFDDAHDSLFKLSRAHRAMAVDAAAASLMQAVNDGIPQEKAVQDTRSILAGLLNKDQLDRALAETCKSAGIEITCGTAR